MGFLIGCIALGTPRIAIIFVVIFSDYFGRAFETNIWPLLGFFFMPTTALAYAWAINSSGSLSGFQLVIVVIAALIDLGTGGGASHPRVRGYVGVKTER